MLYEVITMAVVGERLDEFSETVSSAALEAVIATARERAIEGPRRDP